MVEAERNTFAGSFVLAVGPETEINRGFEQA